jgi:hypothetical protein
MVKSACGFILALFVVVQAGLNWNGLLDTAIITGFKADSLKYSKGFPLSQYEDIRASLKVDDTDVTGFYGDSVDIQWGWQTFHLCYNSSGVADTCFDQRVIADTLDTAAIGKCEVVLGTSDSSGVVFRSHKYADTLGCSGFAVQSKWFLPEWDEYVRFWVKGIVGNNRVAGGALRVVVDVKRRNYVNVRNQ